MKIFNTLSRNKEELIPLTPGEYKIYVGSSSADIRLQGVAVIDEKAPYSMQQLNQSSMA